MPHQCGTTPLSATPSKSKLYSEAQHVLSAMTISVTAMLQKLQTAVGLSPAALSP